ncbi:PepSY domain-containing protein [Porphyromonas somerae]|uniref:PepSY domain-containing protein n=1 Tax=Porphyromonas somerae TaxID=322095 RepID=UPI001FCAB036|nr:PepSY domain-containing protein [Porphyromonas somerae]BDE82732.1 peptidase [Porphyromonas somerae]
MKLLRFLHKWLGIFMAPLLVMWFLTGFFMIFFKEYPHVEKKQAYALLDPIGAIDSLPNSTQLLDWYQTHTTSGAQLRRVSLKREAGKAQLTLVGSEGEVAMDLLTEQPLSDTPPTLEEIATKTARVTGYSPAQVDTLHQLTQWLPFASRREDLPFIKVSVDDPKSTTLYFSGKSGRLLQTTNSSNRWTSYISTIPHWIYFWQLRQHEELWRNLFVVLSIIGCVMIISGLIVGVVWTVKSRRSSKRRWSPFTLKSGAWLYWHHIAGLLFGLVVLSWMFSGWMTVRRLPKWVAGSNPRSELFALSESGTIGADETHQFGQILAQYPTAKEITFAHYMGRPYYRVEMGEKMATYQVVNGEKVAPLALNKDEVLSYLQGLSLGIEIKTARIMEHYDGYYLPQPGEGNSLPLPVVEVTTAEGSTLYVAMMEPTVTVQNRATRLNDIVYHKLHSYKYVWAYHHPTLRLCVMYFLLTGGLIVSVTGLVNACHALKRTLKRRSKTRKR